MRIRRFGAFVLLWTVTATIGGVASGQAPQVEPGTEIQIDMPGAGSFFLLYVPKDYTSERAWPVIFCYHGLKGKATTGPFRGLTQGSGYVIAGMNYATEAYGERINAELTGPEKAYFDEAFKLIEARIRVDRASLFMGGFSQGGYSTTVLGEQLLERFAGLVMLGAGRTYGDRLPPAPKLIRGKPVFIGVGAKDDVHAPRARAAVDHYKGFGADVTFEEWPEVGHSVARESPKLLDWLLKAGPLRQAQARLAEARRAEERDQPGKALAIYADVAAIAPAHEWCVAAADSAKRLTEAAQQALTEAQQAIDNSDPTTAARRYAMLVKRYADTPFAQQGQDGLNRLKADPELAKRVERAQANQQAEALASRARAADEKQNYAQAIDLYEQYVKNHRDTDELAAIEARLNDIKSDATLMARIREDKAAGECREWLSMADNYLAADKPDAARPLLQKIIENHPDTTWHAEAQKRLKKIGG